MTVSPISPAPTTPSEAIEAPGSGLDAEFAAFMGLSAGPQASAQGGAQGDTQGAKCVAVAHPAKEQAAQKQGDKKQAHPGSAGGKDGAGILSALAGAIAAAAGPGSTGSSGSSGTGKAASASPPGKTGHGKGPGVAASHPASHAASAGPGVASAPGGATDGKATTSPDKSAGKGDARQAAVAAVLPATAQALSARRSDQGATHPALAHPALADTAARIDSDATPTPGKPGAAPAASAAAQVADAVKRVSKEHADRSAVRGEASASLPLTNNAPAAGHALAAAHATGSSAPATGSAAPASAPAPVHSPGIPDQVFGEVTRLISRGDGTHRITLQLHPADLGDVRVTLTVKDGAVNVSLAAGHHAQHALATGAHELHRLLQAAGATSADIVVKDLPVQTPSRFDLDPGAAGGGQGNGHTPDQTAGTRSGDTSARDGTPTGASTPPTANPGTRTRSSGVDVSM